MTSPADEPVDRARGLAGLRRALAIHAEWIAQDPRPPAAQVLDSHPELADLLEPLLVPTTAGTAPAGAGSTAPPIVTSADAADEAPSQLAADALPAGRQLGDFIIETELGRGAMGVVYRARQRGLGRTVALKVLPPAAHLDPRSVARFRRESTVLAALDHPGIVEVLTVGRDAGLEYFAMDLIDGPPLSAVLRQLHGRDPAHLDADTLAPHSASSTAAIRSASGTATGSGSSRATTRHGHLTTAVRLVARVADALAHAHEAGVLHRDVKPGNILVRTDGTPVLTDFGLARRSEAGPSLTRTGDFAGTPFYVAPEQVLDRPDSLDGRADVFALGVTLYELLTLRRPFDGATNHDVVQAILGTEPTDPRRHNPRIPRELAAIVLKALEKSPHRRYHSAAAFAADLQAFLELRPVQARRPGPANRAWRAARREPLKASLIAILLLGVPALTGSVGYLLATAEAVEVGESTLIRQQVEELLQRGTWLAETRATDAALRVLDEARALDPDNVEALAMQMVALARQQRLDEARARLRSNALAPALRSRLLAAALETAGDPTAAAGHLQDLPPPSSALDWFVEGLRALGTVHRGDRERWRDAADAFERAAWMEDGARLLHQLFLAHALGHGAADAPAAQATRIADVLEQSWPERGIAWYWAGFAIAAHDDERYLGNLRRAIELTTDADHRIHYTLGTQLMNRGRLDEAREMLEIATQRMPDDAEAWANLAGTYYLQDQFEASVTASGRAIALTPQRPMFHSNRAAALHRLGRGDEALAGYREALRLDGDERFAQRGFPTVSRELDQVDDAIAFVEELLATGRREKGLFALLTRLHQFNNDGPAMLDALTRGRKAWPDDVSIGRQQAVMNFRAGNRDAALADLAALAERFPSNPQVHQNRAQLLLDAGRAAEAAHAVEALIDAGTLDPLSAELWLALARARAATDAPDAARQAAARGLGAVHERTSTTTRNALQALADG